MGIQVEQPGGISMAKLTNSDKNPAVINDSEFRFDSFDNNKTVLSKKKNHLPAMGWNSWNAFGSGNTEALTKDMADCIKNLELDKLGYSYVVLDDGCYKPERVNGLLSNEEVKFPSGFKALADYIHGKGLKFGMYNDIGTNLCAGAAVGTCGHELDDAATYVSWDIDFIKVDNCYYLWDNATFSDAKNARYVFAPNIKGIKVSGLDTNMELSAVKDGRITGTRAEIKDDYVTGIGTFDGTGPGPSPVGVRSSELVFDVEVKNTGEYDISLLYATGCEEGVGSWIELAIGNEVVYDGLVEETADSVSFGCNLSVKASLKAGKNSIRIMNHRRQENTLYSYAALLEGLNIAKPDHDIILSICEWGKTHPQNWGYKVGDSWRILNDITFRVGSDGNPGFGTWKDGYTPSVTSQYNKAVIMDEFSGLSKGWNDPDMLMIGMDGLSDEMNKTHMAMWCMMNAPLMLGLDLRRVKKGDKLYKLIANKGLISLNQDALGIQAKRIFCSLAPENPDKEYVTDINRCDILAKPLSDGSVALSFINVSDENRSGRLFVDADTIVKFIGDKMKDAEGFKNASSYTVVDLFDEFEITVNTGIFAVEDLAPCDNVTVKVTANV